MSGKHKKRWGASASQPYALVFCERGVVLFPTSPLGVDVSRLIAMSKVVESECGEDLMMDCRIAATLGAICVWCTGENAVAWRAELGIPDGEGRPAVTPLLDQEAKYAEVKRALDSWLSRPTRKLCATQVEAVEMVREQVRTLAERARLEVPNG